MEIFASQFVNNEPQLVCLIVVMVMVMVRVIQLTEFRLKGWNRHVFRCCRENHPGGGVEVRERRKDTSERSDVE